MSNAITRADARKWIGVFCGAKAGAEPKYLEAARETGRAIAARGLGIVFGGGRVGLMAAVADAALAAGGEVIGVIPRPLMAREPAHPGVTRLEIVVDMAVRKQRMIELADAFVTLPGGLGTLDELFEVLTLRQIGQHAKPVGLYNLDGYFDTLLAACREFVARGFVLPGDIDFIVQEPRIEPLLDRLFRS